MTILTVIYKENIVVMPDNVQFVQHHEMAVTMAGLAYPASSPYKGQTMY
jgi:selenocysteine lyase/cysteine desulfurase